MRYLFTPQQGGILKTCRVGAAHHQAAGPLRGRDERTCRADLPRGGKQAGGCLAPRVGAGKWLLMGTECHGTVHFQWVTVRCVHCSSIKLSLKTEIKYKQPGWSRVRPTQGRPRRPHSKCMKPSDTQGWWCTSVRSWKPRGNEKGTGCGAPGGLSRFSIQLLVSARVVISGW